LLRCARLDEVSRVEELPVSGGVSSRKTADPSLPG
jgi:hypothetical protein